MSEKAYFCKQMSVVHITISFYINAIESLNFIFDNNNNTTNNRRKRSKEIRNCKCALAFCSRSCYLQIKFCVKFLRKKKTYKKCAYIHCVVIVFIIFIHFVLMFFAPSNFLAPSSRNREMNAIENWQLISTHCCRIFVRVIQAVSMPRCD